MLKYLFPFHFLLESNISSFPFPLLLSFPLLSRFLSLPPYQEWVWQHFLALQDLILQSHFHGGRQMLNVHQDVVLHQTNAGSSPARLPGSDKTWAKGNLKVSTYGSKRSCFFPPSEEFWGKPTKDQTSEPKAVLPCLLTSPPHPDIGPALHLKVTLKKPEPTGDKATPIFFQG